jgi:hypothetical protein
VLDREAIEDMALIEKTANQTWKNNIEFGELEEIKSPYPQFEWSMRLYDRYMIGLSYDRSTLSINIPTKEGQMALSRVAKETVFRGFDGMKPENLLHNFQVLDRFLRKNV